MKNLNDIIVDSLEQGGNGDRLVECLQEGSRDGSPVEGLAGARAPLIRRAVLSATVNQCGGLLVLPGKRGGDSRRY